jgi:predicted transcriptional regulator
MLKEKVQQVVGELPEDVDVDALVEKLYLLEKIEQGEQQLAQGQGVPHEEAKKRLLRNQAGQLSHSLST